MKKTRVIILFVLLIVSAGIILVWRMGLFRNKITKVILISIDTCRADYLGCYGNSRKITPTIDMIAGQSILFENVITPVPQTLPAHCSMLTGTIPPYHGIHDNLGYQLGSSNITLAEVMQEHGYHTGAIISAFVLDRQFGLIQGFDTYNDRFENEILSANVSERRGDEASRMAIKWLDENKDKEFFLFLHYFDPHFRYEPPEPYGSMYADDLYAGEMAFTDFCIKQVMDKLKDLDIYDSSLIIITGDHGEMLGEHGEAEHGFFIYQSNIKVPLIIKVPGRGKQLRVTDNVSLVDIVPTVCNLLEIRVPEEVQGRDLSGYFKGGKVTGPDRFLYCESFTPLKHNCNPLLGVVHSEWKYIHTTRPELYHVTVDPGETENLFEKEPQRVHLMREHLNLIKEEYSHRDTSESRLELDEEGRKRLESLGYVGSMDIDHSLELDESKKDPKDVIQFHNIKAFNDRAIAMVQQGKFTEVIEAYKQLIEHYKTSQISHHMGTIYVNLAVTLQRAGREEEADFYFDQAVESIKEEIQDFPETVELWDRLGDIYGAQGKFMEVSQSLGRAVSLDPGNMYLLSKLIKSLEIQGRYDDIIGVIREKIEYFTEQSQTQNIIQLQKYLDYYKNQQSQSEK
ncbi:MAG: sulfatase-like hydrolase/transferase [Sedimentisphaerales bacterium]|nr:sulfatase-like hydrolase/transferase [Sedimentisphaerales bacterium]